MEHEAVVFDLWFTLVTPEDHLKPYVSTTKSIPAALGIDTDSFITFWKQCMPEQHRSARPGYEYMAEYMERIGRPMTAEDYEAFDEVWRYHDKALAAPRHDIIESISSLRQAGLKLGLLSNAHAREIRTWSASPLAQYFDVACFSCFIGHLKPEPAAYTAVLDGLGVTAEKAVFVGDGASNELKGARSAGFSKAIMMRGLLAEFGVSETILKELQAQADVTIDTLDDLETLLVGSPKR